MGASQEDFSRASTLLRKSLGECAKACTRAYTARACMTVTIPRCSRPNAPVHDYWFACAWRIALAMRLGTSFKEVTSDIMQDVTAFQEAVLLPAAQTRPSGGKGRRPNAYNDQDDTPPERPWKSPRARTRTRARANKPLGRNASGTTSPMTSGGNDRIGSRSGTHPTMRGTPTRTTSPTRRGSRAGS